MSLTKKEAMREWQENKGGTKKQAREAYRSAVRTGRSIGKETLRNEGYRNARDWARNVLVENSNYYPEAEPAVIDDPMAIAITDGMQRARAMWSDYRPALENAIGNMAHVRKFTPARDAGAITPKEVINYYKGTGASPFVTRPEYYPEELRAVMPNRYRSIDMLNEYISLPEYLYRR